MPVDKAAFDNTLDLFGQGFEKVMDQALPVPEGSQAHIMKAMRYAALGGGKRLRPFLLIEAARLLGMPIPAPDLKADIWRIAAALECVHVYSLIHDDLPCMDDDDVRRGKPALHKAFDEAIAVLAGDALLTLAFELMAKQEMTIPANVQIRLMADLARASGTHGMIGGQVMDIMPGDGTEDEQLIRLTQSMKTGALIRYAVLSGGRIAGAHVQDIDNLDEFAQALGLAFQIRDDILDAEGDAATVGKAVGKDRRLGKATFVSIYGLDGAKNRAKALGDSARKALISYEDRAQTLTQAVYFVLNRQK